MKNILIGILLACLLTELCLQVTDDIDYDSVATSSISGLKTYRPGETFHVSLSCYKNEVKVNSLGFHAPEPPPEEKPSEEFRIVLVGNSFVEGVQVPIDSMLSSRLERLLNENPDRHYTYRIIPIAFSGAGPFRELQYLSRYGLSYHPDLIISTLLVDVNFADDLHGADGTLMLTSNGSLKLYQTSKQPSFLARQWNHLTRSSKLWSNMVRVERISANSFKQVTRSLQVALLSRLIPKYSKTPSHDALTRLYIDTLKTLSDKEHAQTLVVSALPATIVDSDLQTTTSQQHIPYINILPAMERESLQNGQPLSLSCDEHWNAYGHEVAAQTLFDYLKTHPALITR